MTETPQELIARLRSGIHRAIQITLGGVTHDQRCLEAADAIEASLAREAVQQAVIERLRKAGNWLSVCAQTSGGTPGRDSALVDAISDWTAALPRGLMLETAQASVPNPSQKDD